MVSDLGLQCLPISHKKDTVGMWVKHTIHIAFVDGGLTGITVIIQMLIGILGVSP